MSWPVPHQLTVPFCFALLLLTSGYALVRMALPLRQLPEGGSVTSLPLYAARNWQGRVARPVIPANGDVWAKAGEVLNVYIWTAVGSIKDPERRILISTGHSALEMPPDLYISHYPLDDIDHSPDDFRALLSAGHENDVAGRFNESLAQESADWCEPDQKVTFHRFNPQALRIFWQAYSQDKTYNLTARNCSTTVIQALDAALEGASYNGHIWRDLFKIISNPQFWLLRLVRGRAEALTWTPGLVLDYTRLLHSVVEHGDRRWRSKLSDAFSTGRKLAHVAERDGAPA
jgi:hypothetical protein